MTETVRIRGELPFPAAGEGVALRFTNPDCDKLQEKFGENWFLDSIARCNRFDMAYIRECILLGAKKDGKKFAVEYDKLDCTVVEMAETVLDALFLAMQGRTFNDHLEYLDSKRNVDGADNEGNGSSPDNT